MAEPLVEPDPRRSPSDAFAARDHSTMRHRQTVLELLALARSIAGASLRSRP